jgi:hypothetical protein
MQSAAEIKAKQHSSSNHDEEEVNHNSNDDQSMDVDGAENGASVGLLNGNSNSSHEHNDAEPEIKCNGEAKSNGNSELDQPKVNGKNGVHIDTELSNGEKPESKHADDEEEDAENVHRDADYYIKLAHGNKRKKVEKFRELKQMEIDLKNEEAKLVLLKRLFYSQKTGQQRPASSSAAAAAQNGQAKQQQMQNRNQQNINNQQMQQQRLGQNNSNNNNINNIKKVKWCFFIIKMQIDVY